MARRLVFGLGMVAGAALFALLLEQHVRSAFREAAGPERDPHDPYRSS